MKLDYFLILYEIIALMCVCVSAHACIQQIYLNYKEDSASSRTR